MSWWFPWILRVNNAAHWSRNMNKCNFSFFHSYTLVRLCFCQFIEVSNRKWLNAADQVHMKKRVCCDDRCVFALPLRRRRPQVTFTLLSALFQSSAGCLDDDLLLLHRGVVVRPRPRWCVQWLSVRNVDLSCNLTCLQIKTFTMRSRLSSWPTVSGQTFRKRAAAFQPVPPVTTASSDVTASSSTPVHHQASRSEVQVDTRFKITFQCRSLRSKLSTSEGKRVTSTQHSLASDTHPAGDIRPLEPNWWDQCKHCMYQLIIVIRLFVFLISVSAETNRYQASVELDHQLRDTFHKLNILQLEQLY